MSLIGWRSHCLRRKVRSTLSAETQAMCEGTEAGDLLRAYVAESRSPGFDLRTWPDRVAEIRMLAVTDCKSLFDHLSKQGSAPADDARLQLDIQILRDMMVNANLGVRWVATYQMLADCLTKNTSSRYLAYVMREGLFHLIRHPDIEWVYVEEKQREQIKKREYIQKYRSEAKRAKGKAARVDSRETLVEKPLKVPKSKSQRQRGQDCWSRWTSSQARPRPAVRCGRRGRRRKHGASGGADGGTAVRGEATQRAGHSFEQLRRHQQCGRGAR